MLRNVDLKGGNINETSFKLRHRSQVSDNFTGCQDFADSWPPLQKGNGGAVL